MTAYDRTPRTQYSMSQTFVAIFVTIEQHEGPADCPWLSVLLLLHSINAQIIGNAVNVGCTSQ